MKSVVKIFLVLFVFSSVLFTSCRKADFKDIIEKVRDNGGDKDKDKDEKDRGDKDKGDKDRGDKDGDEKDRGDKDDDEKDRGDGNKGNGRDSTGRR
ncbi:MAG: hypothetical protein ISP74_00435 [Bacteroidia bacterium]|nr:hypothetical protein [Bacteroidia bacterium]